MGIRDFLARVDYREALRIADVVYHSIAGRHDEPLPPAPVPAVDSAPPSPAPPATALAGRVPGEKRGGTGLVLQWLALAAIVAYTVVSGLQVKATRDQLAEIRRESALADRPYVYVSILGIGQNPTTRRAQATVSIANYGRSPALNTRTADALVVGDQGVALSSAESDFFRGALTTEGIPIDLPPMTPGDNRVTYPLASPSSGNLLQRALFTDGGIKVLVRSEYSDLGGAVHQTEACFYRRADSAIGACDRFNDLR